MTAQPANPPLIGQALRFGLLSAMSFTLNLGVTVAATELLGLSSFISVALAMVLTTLSNFLILRYFVFPGAGQGWCQQFSGFVASIAGFRLAEYLAFAALHGGLGWHYLPVYASVLIVSLVGKFLLLRKTVFRPSPAHAAPGRGDALLSTSLD
ncbi:MAG: GtrA family protein [Planctomycetota bacterium]